MFGLSIGRTVHRRSTLDARGVRLRSILISHVERRVRNLSPFVVTMFLVILNAVPLPVPGYAVTTPVLALMAVYHWSVFRPDLMPAAAVFVIGLLHDALSGPPMGINALALLLVHGIMISQRRFFIGKSFLVLWWGFILVALGASLVTWTLTSLVFGAIVPPTPVVAQAVLTIILYPCLSWVLVRVQRAFLSKT